MAALIQTTTPFSTAARKRTFFTDVCGLSAECYAALGTSEGITMPSEIHEFKNKDWDHVASNLRCPPEQFVAAVDPDDPSEWTRQAPFLLSAMSLKKLKFASEAARYYLSIERELTIENMQWIVITAYHEAYESITDQKDTESSLSIPKLAKNNMKVTRWSETARNYFETKIGHRDAPLAYVIRDKEGVRNEDEEPLLRNKPFSEEHCSVQGELIARLSHDKTVFADDQALVYNALEESFRGTIVGPTILPYKKGKKGHAAWMATISQHAGKARWEGEIKTKELVLKTQKYKATGTYTLAKHCEVHSSSHIKMQAAALNVDYNYQVADDRTRVRWLLESIKCKDVNVLTRIAGINSDESIGGKKSNFESAVAYLTPSCPVASKKKRGHDDISTDASIPSIQIKDGKGNTGVDLRYHKHKEFHTLSQPQKDELSAWRETAAGKAAFAASRSRSNNGGLGGGRGRGRGGGTSWNAPGRGSGAGAARRKCEITATLMEMNNENIAKHNASQEGINALAAALSSGDIVLPAPADQATAGSTEAAAILVANKTASVVTTQHTDVAIALSNILRGNNGQG
jgi:hypothetical protein